MDWVIHELGGLVISGLFGAVVTAMTVFFKRQKAVEEGLKALLKSEIRREYKELSQKEFIAIADLDSVEDLYKPYHAMGGNGTGTELVERIRNMPTSPPIKKGVSV